VAESLVHARHVGEMITTLVGARAGTADQPSRLIGCDQSVVVCYSMLAEITFACDTTAVLLASAPTAAAKALPYTL
jgi:hypothetical protein